MEHERCSGSRLRLQTLNGDSAPSQVRSRYPSHLRPLERQSLRTGRGVSAAADRYHRLVRRAGSIGCFVSALSLISTSGVAAQSSTVGDGPASPANQQTAKVPPPPLFPKHRRGIYTNAAGVEVIDATPQSPPLDTDDPAVPDVGQYEINVTTHADLSREASRIDLLTVDANYGLLPTIVGHLLPTQIKFECPLVAAREAGEPFNVGVGAAAFGMKLKFYHDEHRGISAAIYPQVEFAAPGGRGVEKGLSERGQTLLLPLLVAREFREFTFVFNAALEKPAHDPGRQIATEFG